MIIMIIIIIIIIIIVQSGQANFQAQSASQTLLFDIASHARRFLAVRIIKNYYRSTAAPPVLKSIYGNITVVFYSKPHIICGYSVKYTLTQKNMVLAVTYSIFNTDIGGTGGGDD